MKLKTKNYSHTSRVAILTVVLGLYGSFAQSASEPTNQDPCERTLTLSEPKFHFDDPRIAFTDPQILGTGQGTKVYLVRDSQGNFRAEKQYESEAQFFNDLRAFKILKQLTQNSELEFHLPSPEFTQRTVIQHLEGYKPLTFFLIPYFPGRTVKDLSNDLSVPEHVRLIIKEKYFKGLEQLKERLRTRLNRDPLDYAWQNAFVGFNERFQWNELPLRYRYWPMHSTSIAIKPDNIIVDPWTLQLTIIDPY